MAKAHKKNLHTLIVTMENQPGVLNRVTSMIRRRRFNIESLSVGHSEKDGISRMTLVVDGSNTNVEQVIKQMYKLISILKVYDVTNQNVISNELAIVKVHATKSTRLEIQQITQMFDAKVLDISLESLVIQIVSETKNIDSFLDLMRSFGIKEYSRTGAIAMQRGAASKMQN